MALRSTRSTHSAVLASLLILQLAFPTSAAAQDERLARVPVRAVHGKLVVECDVSTKFRRLPVNLFLQYDTKCGLQLHNRAAAGLRAEGGDGSTVPITLHFGDFAITIEKREHGDEDFLDDFTRYHSKELGEKAVVGTVGAEILAEHHLVFDLATGVVEIGPPLGEDPTAPDPVEGSTVVSISEHNGLAWLPVRYADGRPAALAVGTSRYDTLVDVDVCDAERRPAGDLPSLRLGDIELTEFVALRPEQVVQVHPDGVAGVLGLNLLECFRIELDRVNRVARLTQTAAADYPEADFAFFQARCTEEAEPLAAFLEAHPHARLAREAAERLLDLRLEEDAPADDCRRAVRSVHDTYPDDLRATAMLDLMKVLREARQPQLAIAAGELGVESGREDRYPDSVHKLHGELGELELAAGDGKSAWRHLLSAAFGLPEDGMVNLNLGRYYEQEGRLKRAYSRYVQAVIKPESGPDALEGLDRLQSKMTGEDRMSVDQIERLIAGKVHGFGAATRFEATEDNTTDRVVLVELFTNANLGDGSRGSIAGALANDGLQSHFSGEHVAFITYHVDEPELVPMTTELGTWTAAHYGGVRAWTHVVDGRRRGPGAGRWRQKEAIYNECRQLVLDALRVSPDFDLELLGRVRDGVASGTLTVRGPAREAAVVQIVLVERGVLFPGRSEVVVHRNVARAALTASVEGVPFTPVDGAMQIGFERSLERIRAQNERYLDELTAQGKGSVMKMSMAIDPRQVRFVAFVRDGRTKRILQAISLDAAAAEDPK